MIKKGTSIILINSKHRDLTNYKVYKTIEDEAVGYGGAYVVILDDVGDRHEVYTNQVVISEPKTTLTEDELRAVFYKAVNDRQDPYTAVANAAIAKYIDENE